MIDAELMERLIAVIMQHVKPTIPLSVALWDTRDIGAYLKRSTDRVRSDIVCLPTFPKPIRLPVKGARALYKAREVIAWAESHST